ncbi:MAG: hypothetical protein A2Y10_05495 [Planctomycetes bacterium GWF2_41_51]|nr:MAG: hypothetical protein A2Y10_05495 [Planctomycetes bacterium GWF2_41_51]HBG26787.1 hypothetical protein [Phycisphaerales bacterium]
MCCMMKKLFLYAIILSWASIAAAAEVIVASYEPTETNLIVSSSNIHTIEKIQGGVAGAPFATNGGYVLKLSWTNQTNRKVEIMQNGLNYNFAGYNKMLIDVFVPAGQALFQPNGIIGIWSYNWQPGNWAGGNIVPMQNNKWFTIEIDITPFNTGLLDYISAIVFENYGSDSGTIYIDNLRLANNIPIVSAAGHDSRIDLSWQPVSGSQSYNIYRADSFTGPFAKINTAACDISLYSDFVGLNGQTEFYYVTSVIDGFESSGSEVVSGSTFAMTDEQLLNSVEEATFRYFWDYAHPSSGVTRDTYYPGGITNTCAVGGTGMGLMAICIGIERGFITRQDAIQRILKILDFLENTASRYHGAWAHFADCVTGQTLPFISPYDDGADLVETAYVAQGLLTVRQYFNSDDAAETSLRDKATQLWEGIDWYWYLRRSEDGFENSEILYWHWSPNYGWIMNAPISNYYNEVMITYLLAIASPTHPIPASCYYNGWIGAGDRYKNGIRYYGYTQWVGSFEAPMFWTHYTFMTFDPRNKWDNYCNYFENSRNIALIDRAYCIDNPKGFTDYGENVWGLTASVNPWGYSAHAPGDADNGTISPTAALSSIAFTSDQSITAMKYFYHHYGASVWNAFGFVDAFNPTVNWFASGQLAIDQGPIIVMMENYRTGLCWDLFMSNPEISTMLENIEWATRADNGLNYEYYEGAWNSLPDFNSLIPVAQGKANNFDIALRQRDENYALRFIGFIEVPATGSYTFYTNSDDGSKLYIDENLVVDNDGLHGMQERSGNINLTAGKHQITVTFFEKDGSEELLVSFSGPGFSKKQVPVNILFRCDFAGDYTSDCKVDFDDVKLMADDWLNGYTYLDFSKLAKNWLEYR